MESHAHRRANVLAHLEGSLDEEMLHAMQGVWSMLEHAAADAPSHARAVRARMFWESLTPGGIAAAPSSLVTDLQAAWDADEESAAPVEEQAEGFANADAWVDADAA